VGCSTPSLPKPNSPKYKGEWPSLIPTFCSLQTWAFPIGHLIKE
jgi:hypothetical protein